MPDLIEERVRAEFARFRGEVAEELRPPGPAAARRTVIRRGRVRTGLAAGGLMVVLVGAIAWLGPHRGVPGMDAPGTDVPSDLDALTDQALLGAGVPRPFASLLPGVWWWHFPDENHTGPLRHTFGSVAEPLPAGEYQVETACAGVGSMRFTWESTAEPTPLGDTGEMTYSCEDGGRGRGVVVLGAPGELRFTVERVEPRVRPAAFAVAITDPRAVAARAALGPPDDRTVDETAGYTPGSSTLWAGPMPGRYHLTVVCIGAGTLQVTMATVGDETSGELVCQPGGAQLELELTVPLNAPEFTYGAMETTGRSGEAGYAFRLVRGS